MQLNSFALIAAMLLIGWASGYIRMDARARESMVRYSRNAALRATDWTQMADAPLTALEKTAFQVYRQALRDMPSLPGFPDVPWPEVPNLRDGTASSGGPIATP